MRANKMTKKKINKQTHLASVIIIISCAFIFQHHATHHIQNLVRTRIQYLKDQLKCPTVRKMTKKNGRVNKSAWNHCTQK
jgi:hypothetical protein